MSLLLSLDTSHNSVSVALFEQEACLRFETLETSFQNTVSARLAPMIQDIFNQEKRALEDVAALVINRGPGSFTGLRSGMAFMQGLALAGSIPLYGVTGFQALSGQKPQEWDADKTVYLLDTKCKSFYAGFLKDGEWQHQVVQFSELEAFLERFSYVISDLESLCEKEGRVWVQMKPTALDVVTFYLNAPNKEKLQTEDLFYLKEPLS